MTHAAGGQKVDAGCVRRILRAELHAVRREWDFASCNRANIDANWQRASRENPGYFNGRVFILTAQEVVADVFTGALIAVDFKDFIYWRDNPNLDTTVFDCFGSAIIVSQDGAVLLGRQRRGNINAGLTYFPGGFIDERDVGPDGKIDIEQSVLREAAEETGLVSKDLVAQPELLLTTIDNQISLGVVLTSKMSAAELLSKVDDHLVSDPEGELESAIIIRSEAELDAHNVPDYARCLVRHYFAD